MNALGIIRAAIKLKGAIEIARHPGVESVDVMSRVAFAVFEAKDIDRWRVWSRVQNACILNWWSYE